MAALLPNIPAASAKQAHVWRKFDLVIGLSLADGLFFSPEGGYPFLEIE
jgi:hypothetical protein